MDHHLPDEVEKIDEYSGTKPPPFRPHYEKFLDPTIGSNRTVEYSIGIGESFVGDLAVSKVIPISEQNGVLLETSKNICQREAKIIKAARHDHIITIFKTYFLQKSDTSLNFYIVMDRAEGDLSNYLRLKPKELDGRWIGCLIGVVAYIHRLGIRHRDIKPENILVKGNRVLLTDFGTAHMSLGKTVPTTLPQWIKGRTEAYCAPEVNEDKGRSRGRSADIFSLGAVTLEVLLARSYQEEYENLKTKIKHGTNAKSFATNIKGVHDLLAKLLTQPVDSDWHLKIFSLCQQMLAEDRDQRPLADDMESDWNSLVLQNNTLSCPTCANGVPKTDSNDLITACKNGQEEEVLKLLDNHVSPNTTGAIHQAAVVGSLAIVNMLLNAGADVNIKDYAGQTALHYAAVNGHKNLVKELLSKKTIIVESKDVEGQTPLHCGAANGCETVIRMLLDQKADIDAIDEGGLTPLHFAARRGHEKAIKLLLDRGANAKKEDKSFCTAQDYAIAKGLGDFKDIQKNRPEKRRRWLPCLKYHEI